MSRTTLCLVTAAVLASASLAVMVGRYMVLGEELKVPRGPGTCKVTMLISGKIAGSDARLQTAVPLDFGRQHISHEAYRSAEFSAKPPEARHPGRQHIIWTVRPGIKDGTFRAVYQFFCAVDVHAPSTAMTRAARAANTAPSREEDLSGETRVQSDHPEISALAHRLTAGFSDDRDQFDVLFRYVDDQIGNEPSTRGAGMSALECYKAGAGDARAQSRLLVALCRNRGIPARLVSGLILRPGQEEETHMWAEAWIHDHWVPACPFFHHLGRIPPTYLVFGYGDVPAVRGRNINDLDYAFLIERTEADLSTGEASALHRLLNRVSLYALPPAEQRLVEFLLLLPIAALLVCVFRNIIGMPSFGTFAPALVGLAFRDLGGVPGILVFLSIVLVGWLMRRVLDWYHLLQVPRMAFMLTLVVIMLIGSIVAANYQELPATRYIPVFPMVILTGMIERFWTMESEDGAGSSFRTLLGTLLIAGTISLTLSSHALVRHMLRFPETLGLIMAVQLLIGRYTGYRLTELFRFREFVSEVPSSQ
jgi:hypothetical protein